MQLSAVRRQVRQVLIVTLILNAAVALGKIAVGVVSGSLAIAADGVHSLIDGSSNVVALLANRIADKPPDAEHPYGHRRFETMAALLIGVLLLLVAWEVIIGAVERLQNGTTPDITPVTLGVLVGTLAVNLFVSRYERREGERLRSELLIADSANTRADVFVTLSVLASALLVKLTGWTWLDPLAALIIVVLIGRAAWQVLSQTGKVLVDTAPYSPEQLTALVVGVPGVNEVVRARSRGTTDAAQIDIDVRVAPETTADHTDAIAAAIRANLHTTLTGVGEIEVHFLPDRADEPDYALTARARADALGLATHEVTLREGDGGVVLEMHVEVPPGQTLDAAHEQVTQLEHDVQASLPDVVDVVTHIEPAHNGESSPQRNGKEASAIKAKAMALLTARYPDVDWHDLRVHSDHDGLTLALHASMTPNISVEAAHHTAEDAETLLRAEIPALRRVTIHTEPWGE